MGGFKNAGREWQPKGQPEKSLVHDFPQYAAGKAIPSGIYDIGRNEAWVSVGCDHDIPAFAMASLRRWWEEMGKGRYPKARELFITADAGRGNGYRSRAWKHELQRFADEARARVHVNHFPPGTSKWNKIIEPILACVRRTRGEMTNAQYRDARTGGYSGGLGNRGW